MTRRSCRRRAALLLGCLLFWVDDAFFSLSGENSRSAAGLGMQEKENGEKEEKEKKIGSGPGRRGPFRFGTVLRRRSRSRLPCFRISLDQHHRQSLSRQLRSLSCLSASSWPIIEPCRDTFRFHRRHR